MRTGIKFPLSAITNRFKKSTVADPPVTLSVFVFGGWPTQYLIVLTIVTRENQLSLVTMFLLNNLKTAQRKSNGRFNERN